MTELPLIENDLDLLPALRNASNEMLDPLVGYITDDGKGRVSSQLDQTKNFIKHQPDHKMYVDDIAAEIQKFGGNTFVNQVFRGGKGVPYAEIVRDVAGKLDVNFHKTADVAYIEQQVLLKILEKSWDKMDEAQRKELMETLKQKTVGLPSAFPVMAVQAAIRLGGFASYQIALIIANAVAKLILGRGLALAGNVVLVRAISVFAGPIGWAVTAIWTAIDLAGPAYRVTIPCVVQVAAIRQMQMYEQSVVRCENGHENMHDAAFCNTCGAKIG